MKKILSITLPLFLLFANSGCLKDKGFENQEYGMHPASANGVSFPQAKNGMLMGAFTAQAGPVVVRGPLVALEGEGRARANVNVTITQNNALIPATMTPLPAGSYTITSNATVLQGGRLADTIRITINNSLALDPARIYGVGLTISGADQGYTVAANQKDILLAFSIKNKYDASYRLRIKTAGWGAYSIADGIAGDFPGEIQLITASEASVSWYSTENRNTLQPAFVGGVGSLTSPTGFGATTPVFVFNRATDALVDVRNSTPDDGRGRALLLNPAVTDNRFDPATRTIYAAYIMKQNGRPDQFIYDTLRYVRERD